MKLTKHLLNAIFENTKEEFNKKVAVIFHTELEYVDRDFFLKDAKENRITQMQIDIGIYDNFEKEFPTFLVVYPKNKNLVSLLSNGCYKVSVCYEIAKDKLKPFTFKQGTEYLKHGFAHEICHIYEDDLKLRFPQLWLESMKESKDMVYLANEGFAEKIADMISNNEDYQYVENKLWYTIKKKMSKITRRD